MIRAFSGFFISLALLCGITTTAFSSEAILIGANNYSISPLSNPVNDISFIAENLKNNGWRVTTIENPTARNFKSSIKKFAKNIKEKNKNAVLFYFSGHGFQLRGENYMVPVDANGPRVVSDSLSISEIVSIFESIEAPKILIVDACRNYGFGEGAVISTGLNSQQAPPNTLIAYATSPGEYAFDGPANSRSPYAEALGSSIQEYSNIFEVFQHTRLLTMRQTGSQQIPWESSSLIQNVSFHLGGRILDNVITSNSTLSSLEIRKENDEKVNVLLNNHNNIIVEDLNSAAEYLMEKANNSPDSSFYDLYPEVRVSLSPEFDRKNIVETLKRRLRWIKEPDRRDIWFIANALQDGVLYPSCVENNKINFSCGTFDKKLIFEPNMEGALKIAIEADRKNMNSAMLARHYQNGWVVEKDLLKAYDLYIKDKNQYNDSFWAQINEMMQIELNNSGFLLSVDGDFGNKSCNALRKIIGETNCKRTVTREQVERFVEKIYVR